MKIAILSLKENKKTTGRLVKAIRKRGHRPVVINYKKAYMEIEQDKPNVHYLGKEIKGVDAIIPRIGASNTAYGSAVVRQFEMKRVFTTAKSIAIVRSRDKLRSLQLLAREGVPIPKTAFASHVENIKDLISQVGGPPVIVKLTRSTHGKGVVIAETSKAARSVIQAFYSIGAPILVQEFIAEADGADIRAIVVGGRVVAGIKRQGLDDDFRANVHQGGSVEVVELTAKERRVAIKAAKVLGLDIAGVDMLRSERGPLVIEVNSSPSLEGAETATKKDIAGAMIEFIEDHVTKKPKKDRVGA
jgi:ribosomal protein S6--L-glutamate ligase